MSIPTSRKNWAIRGLQSRWVLLAAALIGFVALYHVAYHWGGGGLIVAEQFVLTVFGGFLLWPVRGMLFGLAVSIISVLLCVRESGFNWYITIGNTAIGPVVGWAAGSAAVLGRFRTQAERLREADRLVKAIFDTIPYHLFVKDVQGKFLMVNRSMAVDHGVSAEAFIGQADIPGRTPEEQDIRKGEDREIITQGLSVDREVLRHLPGGELRHYHLIKRTLRDEEGESVGLVGLAEDISERKLEELRRAELEDQLRHAQRMEIVGQLAAGIAHDFNNLLTPIIGQAEMIRDALPHGHAAATGAGLIEQAAMRAAELTRSLLAFGRKQVLDVQVLDLNREIGNLVPMARRVIGSDIELRLHLGGGLGRVKADASRIHQVLMNLLVNARDAMPAGGVVVVATENVELDESAAARVPDLKPGSYVTFSVSDTGQGMTEQVQARIFEPFFTTKETGKGTGLGLATVWGIVSQHRGGISVFSQPGIGSTFKVLLPRTSETGATVPAGASALPSPDGTERVLVVDDNTLVLDFMATALAAHGYRVRQAGSPTAALAIADQEPQGFALLLTDLSMPKMNGIELYSELKRRYPALKVLYASGHPPDLYPELMNSRALLLNKPFPAQRLLVRVREVLDG